MVKSDFMMRESSFYTKLYEENINGPSHDLSNKNTVQCNLCRKYCKIVDDSFGFCNSQKNIDGKLFSCNYQRIASSHTDPIEKKPLYHFLPGSSTYSINTTRNHR